MIFQATLHSTLSTRIILKMSEMASRDLQFMQKNRTTGVGAFSTNIEFDHHQHFTSRQQDFLSRNGGAFSQHIDVHMPERVTFSDTTGADWKYAESIYDND